MLPRSVEWLPREAQTPVADGRGRTKDNHQQTGIIDCLRGVGQNRLHLEPIVLLQNALGRCSGHFFFLCPKLPVREVQTNCFCGKLFGVTGGVWNLYLTKSDTSVANGAKQRKIHGRVSHAGHALCLCH